MEQNVTSNIDPECLTDRTFPFLHALQIQLPQHFLHQITLVVSGAVLVSETLLADPSASIFFVSTSKLRKYLLCRIEAYRDSSEQQAFCRSEGQKWQLGQHDRPQQSKGRSLVVMFPISNKSSAFLCLYISVEINCFSS